MIIKHLKILHNFFLDKKIITFTTIILLLIVFSIDNTIIYLANYEIIFFIKNSTFSIVFNLILGLIGLKFILYVTEIFYSKYRFYKIFNKNLFRFFTSLPQNKEIFGKNQQLDNILKFQWEINILANETNKNYFTIVSNFSKSLAALFFILLSLFYNFNINNIAIFSISFSLLALIFISQNNKIQIEKKILDNIDKNFLIINQSAINQIESTNITESNQEYKQNISTNLAIIKNIFNKIFLKKTLLETLSLIIKIFYIASISYLALDNFKILNIKLNECVSFVLYNIIFYLYSQKLINNLFDRNIFSIISQNNIPLLDKSTEKENDVRNQTSVESFSFQNVKLKSKHGLLEQINFSTKIKNATIMLSESNDISLIRKYFENKYVERENGEILINDADISKFNQETLKNIIVTISCDIQIHNDTIKRNILPENSQISDDVIIKACKLSYLYDYIASSKVGYYTMIDNETQFSPLEKFQISLTRALLSDGHIIIIDFTDIDEDNYIVKNIKEMLISNLIDRILIIITNSTFKCEEIPEILFFEDGKLICKGNHANLIQKSNQYCNFYLKNHKDIKFSEEEE